MRFALSLLGQEVFAIEIGGSDDVRDVRAIVKDEIVELIAELDKSDKTDTEVTGGAGGSFERDPHPASPDDRYAPWEDKFGFSQ